MRLLKRLGFNGRQRAAAAGSIIGAPLGDRMGAAGAVSDARPRLVARWEQAGKRSAEKNLKWLREQGYRYLVVSRERKRQFDGAAAVSLQTASRQQVQVQQVVSEDATEVRLYCYSRRVRARSRRC